MTQESALPGYRDSAFYVADTGDKPIVDVLIEERCPSFVDHFTWPVVRPVLYALLGYRKARRIADDIAGLPGAKAFEYLCGVLRLQVETERLERVPASGRCVVAANHPTGLADGIAMWDCLRQVRKDVVFFANADALRVNPAFEDVIIPVEWVMEKRSPAKARETLRRAGEAFAEEKCVVIFPSGKLARKVDGKLTEQDWFSTFYSLARKQAAPIVPIGMSARNSWLYYTLARLSGELRDITLFNELLNKVGDRFVFHCGHAIDPTAIDGSAAEITPQLRDHVAYGLTDDPDRIFVTKA
jgi:putative hemolysin